MRWITLLPFSAKTTIRISILTIMPPHEGWVSAGLSGILKNTPTPHQCNSSWESGSTMLRCYLKQQRILLMRFPKSSGMITNCISAGFSTSWKDIHLESTEKWGTSSDIHNVIKIQLIQKRAPSNHQINDYVTPILNRFIWSFSVRQMQWLLDTNFFC